ncbi:hypothetical protein [Butyrivibrio sp. WCD2001]|uniref:hypothetical protein n=1 Tax=Butyrivibrio sp. WCD2001 TaxID=1280681 RepID=UPI0004225F3A|nr:hypothetical protein [Butyrivibrio sp. WCD2001]
MVKISKIGAVALAMALSVTFLTPTTALAAKKVEDSMTLQKVSDYYDDAAIIDKDVKSFADITETAATYGAARDAAYKKMFDAFVANGIATTTKPADNVYCDDRTISGTTYYYDDSDTTWSYDDDDDGTVYTVKLANIRGTVYKNSATGKTSMFRSEVDSNYTADEAAANQFQSAIMLKKGEITYLRIPLEGGDTAISKVKSSKKSVVTAKAYNKLGGETVTNADGVHIEPKYDAATDKTTYTVWYQPTVGARVVVGTYEKYDDAEAAVKASTQSANSATRYIALDAKKVGKSKLSFSIVNKNGTVTPVKVNVYVVEKVAVFKQVTFAGKSLLDDYSKTNNINYGKVRGEDYWNLSTKKSGKLVVKTNKNFQVKKIEIGKLYKETITEGMSGTNPQTGEQYDHSNTYSAYNRTSSVTEHRVDLNGDGDFDDIIGGISESEVTYKFTPVKSGKKITLSTVGNDGGFDSSLNWTSKDGKNTKGEILTGSSSYKNRNYFATTVIRVTYFDKISKTYGQEDFFVKCAVKK